MQTRSIKQKTRETEGQEQIQMLQEAEVEEQTKIDDRNANCKEDKMMLIQLNSAIINKLEETNSKLEEKLLNKLEEINQQLDETRTAIRTKMDQSMQKIQRQFKNIQEKIGKKWEKKYVELDCKMVERKVQVDRNSGQINAELKILGQWIPETR
ncbi:hypothetical protein FQA39_LY17756 [Lamprigera yunnana]|nr:hypothetical protein FQA39_LY17756 [Lamprigera yunnana]